jgi:hypothetical protein
MSTAADSLPMAEKIAQTPRACFWIALGGASVLHVLFLSLLGTAQPQPDKPVGTPSQRLQWRWVPPATVHQPAEKPAPTLAQPPGPMEMRQARKNTRDDGKSILPAASTANGEINTSSSAGDAPVHQESSTHSPIQAPLQLQLPASLRSRPATNSMLDQALNDNRSNSRRNTLEDGIAHATTGNDVLQVDKLGEGRERVRMNGRCVEVHQARIAQIDPMNEVSRRSVAGLKRCDQ